jgi:ribulose 1,5-bisphosphate synthetase/thiazole synthase
MRFANDSSAPSALATESISSGPQVTSHVDVIVIGAGPAGLMALTRAGVSVRVVDKRAQKVMVGHADGGQARTMEVLHVRPSCIEVKPDIDLRQSYGLLEVLRPNSYEVPVQAFYAYNPESKALEVRSLLNLLKFITDSALISFIKGVCRFHYL